MQLDSHAHHISDCNGLWTHVGESPSGAGPRQAAESAGLSQEGGWPLARLFARTARALTEEAHNTHESLGIWELNAAHTKLEIICQEGNTVKVMAGCSWAQQRGRPTGWRHERLSRLNYCFLWLKQSGHDGYELAKPKQGNFTTCSMRNGIETVAVIQWYIDF